MKRLIPGMKEVLYIGDETYICQQNDYDLKHLMESGYPELKYRFLCSRDIGIDSLFTILNQIDVRTTGILFSSWFQKRVYAGNTVLYANSHRIIATSSVPLFSFKNVGIEEEGGIIGGFIYNKTDYVAHLCETIREIIGGRQARDIPFTMARKGRLCLIINRCCSVTSILSCVRRELFFTICRLPFGRNISIY